MQLSWEVIREMEMEMQKAKLEQEAAITSDTSAWTRGVIHLAPHCSTPSLTTDLAWLAHAHSD
eukprot:scaffold61307_cov32-Tisochrysis_lutea.AAC.1